MSNQRELAALLLVVLVVLVSLSMESSWNSWWMSLSLRSGSQGGATTLNIDNHDNESLFVSHSTYSYLYHTTTVIHNDTGGSNGGSTDYNINRKQVQFQLPFYIYEGELDWSNVFSNLFSGDRLAGNNNNISDNNYSSSNNTEVELPPGFYPLKDTVYIRYKHSDDYWLLQQAKIHPMRTRDPSKATLFFVPTLLNALEFHTYYNYSKLCQPVHGQGRRLGRQGQGKQARTNNHNNNLRCNWDLLHQAEHLLHASPFFQRHGGRDHIVVDSHFDKQIYSKVNLRNSSLFSCNLITFEQQQPSNELYNSGYYRVTLPSYYVGRPCNATTNHDQPQQGKMADFAMVASFKPKKSTFQTRSNICQWLQDYNFSVSQCGSGEQCPALAQARFGFHARGDTFGSNRLMDTLLSGTVPLFTSPEQYKILPPTVPWHEIGFYIDASSKNSFHQSIQSLLANVTPAVYQEKQEMIAKYLHILDHTKGCGQFDAYMAKFASLLNITATTDKWS